MLGRLFDIQMTAANSRAHAARPSIPQSLNPTIPTRFRPITTSRLPTKTPKLGNLGNLAIAAATVSCLRASLPGCLLPPQRPDNQVII